VNDPPVAADDSYSTDEDTVLTVAAANGVLGNDSDAEGDGLTASVADGPAHGVVTLNGDGSFTYTPDADFNGGDSFTYTVSDGSAVSAPATVTISVAAVNDPPVAADDSYSTDEDTVLSVDAADGVLGNDSDADGNGLSVSLVGGPAHGSLVLNADGSFTYTPDADFNGGDSFTYTASDGSAVSAAATVTIAVAAVNDATGDSDATNEDGPSPTPGDSSTTPSPSASPSAEDGGGSPLADTGPSIAPAVGLTLSGLLVGLGLLITAASRRRRA
jgi:VCBS repeat-containing protein